MGQIQAIIFMVTWQIKKYIKFENFTFTIVAYGETKNLNYLEKRVIVEENGVKFGTRG